MHHNKKKICETSQNTAANARRSNKRPNKDTNSNRKPVIISLKKKPGNASPDALNNNITLTNFLNLQQLQFLQSTFFALATTAINITKDSVINDISSLYYIFNDKK
jgi:hypothetical protein